MDRACPHVHSRARATQDLSAALDHGRRHCEAAGERWTAPRQRTYELLLTAPGAVKAYDLISRFGCAPGAAKPPTVYRSLDLLMALGLVHKIEALSAFVACARGGVPHGAGFLICDCCGRVDELDESLATLADDAARGYHVESVRLEISGRCPDCR